MIDRIKPKHEFVGLHNHGTHSIFDGLGYPIDFMRAAYDSGQNALAITEHGNMNSLSHQIAAYHSMKKEGKIIKPIFGIEAYYTTSLPKWRLEYEQWKYEHHRQDEEDSNIVLEDDVSLKAGNNKSILNRRGHLLLLAKNSTGLTNLFKLVSLSYRRENFYRYPRIDRDLIRQHKEGLIAGSACLGGIYGSIYHTKKFEGQDAVIDALREETNWWLETLGEDFYGELQWNASPEQHILNQYVIQLSYEYGFKLISTADAHYPRKELWKDREIYKRLGWLGKSNTEKPPWMSEDLPNNIAETGYELYPKNGDEMWESFLHFSSLGKNEYDYNLVERSLKETCNIAFDKIEDFLPDTKIKLPSWVVPKDKRPEQILARLCANEMKKRNFGKDPVYIKRLTDELYTIKDRGLSKYFLTMKLIVDEAKKMMLIGGGRGSAAGSLVSYLLGITQVDPIKWNLQFERFLTKTGIGMPDIDVDFSNPVVLKEHFKEKWGEYSVIQITNFNTLQVRSLIKDISKFYNIYWEEVNDTIIAMVKETMAKAKDAHDIAAGVYIPTYEEYKQYSPTLQSFLAKYPQVDTHIANLQGMIRSLSSHASGCLIADNLNEHMPLIAVGGKQQTPWTEGQAQRHLEPFGFIKFDLLGLATLEMFETCIKQVLQRRHKNLNPSFINIRDFYNKYLHPDVIDFNNQEIWEEIFHKGKWLGIFQFANRGAQQFCQQVKPRSIQELSDITAIFRPGPLSSGVHEKYVAIKNGEEYPKYVHSIVKEVLEPTRGQLIFQEQIATLAHKLGDNLSLDDGNMLRKLLTKKGTGKNDQLDDLYAKFKKGCVDKGINPKKTEELAQTIEFFNKYGFNLSHSVSYSIISYQCAYLAHHYTPEWCCAFLEREPEERKEKALSIVKSMGFTVEPLNINTSGVEWAVKDDTTLLQPLSSIKGLGPAAVEEIMLRRPFNSIEDLLFNKEISYMRLNKAKLDVLVRSGALNTLIDNRFNHLKHFWISCIVDRPKHIKKMRENIEASKLEPDFTREEKIEFLTVITGLYPLDMVLSQNIKDKLIFTKVPPISEFDKELGVCWCIPKKMETRKTKNNRDYYVVEVVDSNFTLTIIRCWNIRPVKDKLFLNHPYLLKPNWNEKWGFSVSGPIPRNWKLLG